MTRHVSPVHIDQFMRSICRSRNGCYAGKGGCIRDVLGQGVSAGPGESWASWELYVFRQKQHCENIRRYLNLSSGRGGKMPQCAERAQSKALVLKDALV